jgi:hypothetical protein
MAISAWISTKVEWSLHNKDKKKNIVSGSARRMTNIFYLILMDIITVSLLLTGRKRAL